jgi:hypothetical protein
MQFGGITILCYDNHLKHIDTAWAIYIIVFMLEQVAPISYTYKQPRTLETLLMFRKRG